MRIFYVSLMGANYDANYNAYYDANVGAGCLFIVSRGVVLLVPKITG